MDGSSCRKRVQWDVYPHFAKNVTAGKFESFQSLAFSIVPAGGNVSAFEYGPVMSLLGGVGSLVGSLSFRVVPNAHGVANFTITLSDDGGNNEYAKSNSSKHLSIIFNDRPFFRVQDRLVILGNETTGWIPNFVSDLYLGSEEAKKNAFFALTPLSSRIPSWMPANTTNNNVFGKGDSSIGNQLLNTMNISVATKNLFYALKPGRFGEVAFSLQLINGGGLGCNGSLDRTTRNFSFTVLPVNSAPNFTLSSSTITSFEGQTVELPNFFRDVVPGVWADGERNQELKFEIEWNAGDKITFDVLVATCFYAGSTSVDPNCHGGAATLKFLTSPGRFGNVTLRVVLVDNGGTAQGGVDTSGARNIHLIILPVNEKPFFSLMTPNVLVNQDSRCLGLSPTWVMPAHQVCDGHKPYIHVHHGFTASFSLGTFENGECDKSTQCEAQTGQFIITSLDTNASALLFAEMPRINISGSSGILAFTLNKNVTGVARFSVVLKDSGASDGSTKTSETGYFEISVLFHNKAPRFDKVPHLIGYENMGVFSEVAAYNMSTDGLHSRSEPNQLLTFVVIASRPELFMEPPYMLTNGTMRFVPAQDMFGVCNLSVQLMDDGGKSNFGEDSSTEIIALSILPVNSAPTFILQERVITTKENIGAHIYPEFAYQIAPGPKNENCLRSDDFCQAQRLEFVVDDVSNVDLFQIEPRMDSGGSLAFTVAPHATGQATVTVRLEDDGGVREHPRYRGTNTSVRQSFKIVVDPDNFFIPAIPFFNFTTDATCLKTGYVTGEIGCDCRLSGSATAPCELVTNLESPTVVLSDQSGLQEINHFMTQMTPEDGFFPASTAVFNMEDSPRICDSDSQCGATGICSGIGGHCKEIAHNRLAADTVLRALEYAVDYSVSPDGKHVYAAEFETDTLAIFKYAKTVENMQPIDRRSDKEDRTRFTGFGATSSSFGTAKHVELSDVCGLEKFEGGNELFLAGAGGCDDLESSFIFNVPPENCVGEVLAPANCNLKCCETAFAGLVGHWDFSSRHTRGAHFINSISARRGQKVECSSEFCVYSRDRLADGSCEEMHGTKINPATFRDLTGTIGSAIILGPQCKAGAQSDWDAPLDDKGLSALNFILNNGKHEAFMVDGRISTGLYITDQVDDDLRSRLPSGSLTIATWMTINEKVVTVGGLIALQQEDYVCKKGWSLTYSHLEDSTTLIFTISLQGNVLNAQLASFRKVKVRVSPPLSNGEWNHLVASYDGSSIKIYVNGQLLGSEQACDSPPCGNILYPGDRVNVGNCPPTPFTIGTYVNDAQKIFSPHMGAIQSMRVFKNALNSSQVRVLYFMHSGTLRKSAILENEYWVQGSNPAMNVYSPSKDFMAAANPVRFSLRGRFSMNAASNVTYKCQFSSLFSQQESSAATIRCSNAACADGYGNLLECDPPVWLMGYKAAVLAVLRTKNDANSTRTAELWQRVCLKEQCGFQTTRQQREASWMLDPTSKRLLPGLVGTKSVIRFFTDSSVFVFNQTEESIVMALTKGKNQSSGNQSLNGSQWFNSLQPVSSFQLVNNNTNSSQERLFASFNNHSHCFASGCIFAHAEQVVTAFGLSSVTHRLERAPVCKGENASTAHNTCAHNTSTHYLLAANYWDGLNTTATSGVFTFDPAVRIVSFVQGIATYGARRWRHISVNGGQTSLVALASCFGPMRVFYWDPASALPIRLDLGELAIDVPWCQSDLKTFNIGNATYLVASTFANITTSKMSNRSYLFVVGERVNSTHGRFGSTVRKLAEYEKTYDFGTQKLHAEAPVVALAGTFATHAAYSLEQFEVDGLRLIVFASYSSSPSKVFACNASMDPPSFEHLQDLETNFASSSLFFQASGPYLLFGQRGNETVTFRWNGTRFHLDFDKYTLPKDLASGHRMRSEMGLTHTAAYFQVARDSTLTQCVHRKDAWNGSTFSVVDCPIKERGYLLLGAKPTVGSNPSTKLHVRRQEVIQGMVGPVSIQVNPIDGKHVYVACRHSRSIIAFDRDPQSGILVHNAKASYLTPWSLMALNDSYPAGDGYQNAAAWGYPLHGVQSILMSPEQDHLYAVSSFDNALAIFNRDNVTGELTLGSVIQNGIRTGGRTVYGLSGAYGISMSIDGKSIYVSSAKDKALTVIDRMRTGNGKWEFSFVDAIPSEERLFENYNDTTDDTIHPKAPSLQDWASASFPMRMGGNSETWSFSARNSYDFILAGKAYLAIASGESAATSTVVGSANIYEWNRGQQQFSFVQNLPENGAPSAFSFVTLRDVERLKEYNFLSVANTRSTHRPSGPGVNVYRWSPAHQRWDFQEVLLHQDHATPLDAQVNAIASLQVTGKDGSKIMNFMACAYGDVIAATSSNSLIYIYRHAVGFRLLQTVPTVSATDVQTAVIDVPGGKYAFFMFSNFYGDVAGSPDSSSVHVYRFNVVAEIFELHQSIPAKGAYGIESFFMPNEGTLLAIANRQNRIPEYEREYQAYDEVPEIHKWNPALNMFVLHQRLDALFQSVIEDGVRLSLQIAFCSPVCQLAPDGKSRPVNGLRGSTAVDMFESNGEFYLAIAQSVCQDGLTREECNKFGRQPKSAILQWNRVSKLFTEMRGMTDKDSVSSRGYPLTDDELLGEAVSTQALRINGGRTMNLKFVEFDNDRFLVISSQTRGSIVLRFEFEKLSLNGIVDAEPDRKDEFVYAACKFDASLLVFARSERYDSLGNAVKSCQGRRCIKFLKTLHKEQTSGDVILGDMRGLRGAQRVSIVDGQLIVQGNVQRHQLLCGPYPPVGINGDTYNGRPPTCLHLQLETVLVSTNNDGLLRGLPMVSPNGSLSVEIAADQSGSATYRTRLISDHRSEAKASARMTSKEFTIIARQLNHPPSFEAHEVVVGSVTAYREVIFATNVTAGRREDDQALLFEFTYSNALLFDIAPSLMVGVDDAGDKIGVLGYSLKRFVSGEVNFTVILVDDGGGNAEIGEQNTSKPQLFKMTILGNNRPPTFDVAAGITILQNSGIQYLDFFVTNMDAGGVGEKTQNLTLFLHTVYALDSQWPSGNAFDVFEIFNNGSIKVKPAFNRFGSFAVEFGLRDDGGTENGGSDRSYRNSTLFIEGAEPLLELSSTKDLLRITENTGDGSLYDESYTFLSLFELRGQEYDTRVQNVTFQIVSMTNEEMFLKPPRLTRSGAIVLFLAEKSRVRETEVFVQAAHSGTLSPTSVLLSNIVSIKVITAGVNDAPTFHVPPEFKTLEDMGLQVVPHFASYSVGPPDEYWQTISFAVTIESEVLRLFEVLPRIDADGVLSFQTYPQRHGSALLYVQARDDGGIANGGADVARDGPKLVSFTVFPQPRIFSVSPGLGPIYGGTTITIRGVFFGSEYSRGYYSTAYGGITVHVGQHKCLNITYVADSEVICQTPPGVGAASVSLTIEEDGKTRSATFESGFKYALLYYVGMLDAAESSGYFGFSPSPASPGSFHNPDASIAKGQLDLSNPARSLLTVDGTIYIGGSFEFADGKEVNNVARWDGGASIFPLGYGTDAAVNALAMFQGKLVVGGDFQRVFQEGNQVLKSPLLAFWDGDQWSRVGDLKLTGSVSVVVTNHDTLYIGGQFESYGSADYHGLAAYEGGLWRPMNGGVGDGKVLVIGFLEQDVIVGGSFLQAGGIAVKNLARWDSRTWTAMGDFNGDFNDVY